MNTVAQFSSVAQLCPTLCNPTDSARLLCLQIILARILEWVALSSSRGSSWPRDWTCISYVSCIGRWVLTTSATWDNKLVNLSKVFSWVLWVIIANYQTLVNTGGASEFVVCCGRSVGNLGTSFKLASEVGAFLDWALHLWESVLTLHSSVWNELTFWASSWWQKTVESASVQKSYETCICHYID